MSAQSQEVVWTPSERIVENANLTAFMTSLGVASVEELNQKAHDKPEWFNHELLTYIGYKFSTPYEKILDLSEGLEYPKWCIGGKTNVVFNCLDSKRGTDCYEKEAICWVGESGPRKSLTNKELDRETSKLAWGLRNLGLGVGDVIAVYLPNLAEAAIAMLAIAKIGGILLPIFSGLGAKALGQRLSDGNAKAVITVNASLRRGRTIAAKKVVDEALQHCSCVEYLVVLDHLRASHSWTEGRDYWWDDLVAGAPEDYRSIKTEQMEADSPFLLIYTSGTSGKPKGVVHTHCGFPVKAVLDLSICMDLKNTDTFFWMSDMGWLVGPLLVFGGLLVGSKIVLAEGAPDYPNKERFWDIIQFYNVSFLGLSPTLARLSMQLDQKIIAKYTFESLRVIVSTGEVWTPEAWNWVFKSIGKSKIPLLNYAGGTEVGGILTGTVIHPLKPCAFSMPIPGTGADVFDHSGQGVQLGEKGELVMRSPSIGLTRGLWKDPRGYIESYWGKYPGVWLHGDSVSRDADGMWYIHGRTDDVITLSGKRTDPSEIESVVNTVEGVRECAIVGIPNKLSGMHVACFCVLSNHVSTDAVKEEICTKVENELGRSYLPKEVVFLSELPRTRNHKVIRTVIKKVWVGENIQDTSSLLNPEILKEIKAVKNTHGF